MDYLKSMFLKNKCVHAFWVQHVKDSSKIELWKNVSHPIRTHIVLECDGSGNMLFVFSDSVDRLKWVFRGQNWHRSRDINIDTLESFFSCFPSRHGPERFILNVWIPCRSKRSRVSYSLYTLNKTTPESMCMSTTMILTRKLKISELVIRKWEIGIYPLVLHPVTYGLLKVSPDLCNLQKLTSETSKSNPNR